ncbi:hypothetical protein [Flavobacterium sp. CAN_S2]|uniref:hypothetical protein n=1 Tax=Flavobacterium sp. CAN_S2 TaxID=2787726 RepID=UPI0018C9EDE4
MYERTKEIVDAVLKFEERSSETRKIVNAKFLENEIELHYIFRKSLDGFLILVMENLFGKYDDASEKFLYQLNLTISYIRTHFVINNLILDGDLIEAYTLIRKQFEKYTRINELDNKPIEKLRGKTPNLINLFGEAGKEIYPELSEVAHFGHPRVSEFLSVETKDGKKGPSMFPTYKESAIICYDRSAYVALYFSAWLIDFVQENNSKYDRKKDIETFLILEKMALDCNIIRVKE